MLLEASEMVAGMTRDAASAVGLPVGTPEGSLHSQTHLHGISTPSSGEMQRSTGQAAEVHAAEPPQEAALDGSGGSQIGSGSDSSNTPPQHRSLKAKKEAYQRALLQRAVVVRASVTVLVAFVGASWRQYAMCRAPQTEAANVLCSFLLWKRRSSVRVCRCGLTMQLVGRIVCPRGGFGGGAYHRFRHDAHCGF